MGRIERAPDWILKYEERIEKGTITVEDILEEENKTREKPIKISSVTRAISAMGYPITGLRREKKAEVEETKAEVEEREEGKEPVEKSEEPEERVMGPGWLQKYREGIEKGTITVEDILEEENKIRAVPIKLSTVTRAINTLGYPITELRRGKKVEAGVEEEEEGKKLVEKREEPERIERGPGWLQKYRERIEKGTITVEDILEEENKIRAVPIKLSTVTRAINTLGYPITELRREQREEVEAGAGVREEKKKVEKPIEDRGRGPGWLQKYREGIEKGTITVEDILEEENKIRGVPIKISSVTRAISAMGYPITGLRREGKEEVKKAGMAEGVVYSSSIGKISEATEKRFNAIKKSWEKDLGKSLHNDYFVNILLALAKLVEHGKTLAPVPVKR